MKKKIFLMLLGITILLITGCVSDVVVRGPSPVYIGPPEPVIIYSYPYPNYYVFPGYYRHVYPYHHR